MRGNNRVTLNRGHLRLAVVLVLIQFLLLMGGMPVHNWFTYWVEVPATCWALCIGGEAIAAGIFTLVDRRWGAAK